MRTSILGLIALLAVGSIARPHVGVFDDTDPIEQKSRITAFVSNDTGVFVECWEIDDLLPDAQITRKDGSKGTVRRKSMTDDDNFSGVDILTWPAYAQLWPPPLESVHAEWFDLSLFNNMFSIQGGLINFNLNFRFSRTSEDISEQHFFDHENGDDWFYFSDDITSSSVRKANAANPPITVEAVSATETTLINFKYKGAPRHTVLHAGGCSFTGLSSVKPSSKTDQDLAMARFTVQGL